MKPISEYNFREIVGKFVKIATPENIKEIVGDTETVEAVGYIDSQGGICFQIVNSNIDSFIILKYDKSYMLEPIDTPADKKDILENIINISHKDVSAEKLLFRAIELLDPYRDNQFPDDVLIQTYANPPSKELFSVWMSPIGIEDKIIIATAIENVECVNVGDKLCILPSDNGLVAIHYELFKAIEKQQEGGN